MIKSVRLPALILIFILTISYDVPAQQQPKNRIISLTPASTEILFELGLDKEIAGVSSYCNWPPAAKNKAAVGSFSNPNIEKIISLKPDLVILTGMEQDYLKAILSALRIDYISVDPSNLNELLLSIKEIGDITGKRQRAEILIKGINKVISDISASISKVQKEKRPKVYLEIWHDPIMSAGASSFVNDMIEKAGGKNIAGDLRRPYSKIDAETVIYKNPDIIILTYMKNKAWIKERFCNRIGWAGISAIRNNRVFSDINPDLILRPGPRVKEGLLELNKRFYED